MGRRRAITGRRNKLRGVSRWSAGKSRAGGKENQNLPMKKKTRGLGGASRWSAVNDVGDAKKNHPDGRQGSGCASRWSAKEKIGERERKSVYDLTAAGLLIEACPCRRRTPHLRPTNPRSPQKSRSKRPELHAHPRPSDSVPVRAASSAASCSAATPAQAPSAWPETIPRPRRLPS
jgi:hypothetical protein